MKRFLAFVFLASTLFACGRPFKVSTAPGFVPLEEQSPRGYEYRATTPEGIVVAIRVIDDESRGDLDFWAQALTLQLRDVNGYALLATKDVTSRDGTKGKRLELGHDEDGKPYAYWVSVFPAQGRLFIVETGGAKEPFERSRASVEWMLASIKVKCDTIVSPVLASRTCNRW